MKATRGFTLVEILIVVVILGILAAIVVPQFTQASTEAKFNSLCSNLQSIRSQIELYKVQHNDLPPAAGDADPNFTEQMVFCTDIDGAINGAGSKVRDAVTYKYGPYLERLPVNPFNDESGVAGAAGDGVGWIYDDATGEISAADGGSTNGTAHADL